MDLKLVHEVLKRHLKGRTVEDDTPLVSGGLIDSMAIVDLIVDLEDAVGVRIPASEVQQDDFDTPRKIAQTVSRFR